MRRKDVIERPPSKKGLRWHLLSGHNKYLLLTPIIAVAAAVIGIYFIGPWLTDHQRYVFGFDYGNMSAVYDLHNHNPFNPACDPTGSYTTSDGQHPIAYCLGWTQGYISEWNSKHPNYTNGYIPVWFKNNYPTGLKKAGQTPAQRFDSGVEDGGNAAIADSKAGSPFNPGCYPPSAHAPDHLHTTAYCNGWTNGYIAQWNIYHSHSTNTSMTHATKSDYHFGVVSGIVTHV